MTHQVTIVEWSVRVNGQCIGVVSWTNGKIEISVNRTQLSPEELDALVKAVKTAKPYDRHQAVRGTAGGTRI